MPVCIGKDVHSNLITCFAVPLDSYNEEELEFCKEFNREFKNIKADRHSLERMAKEDRLKNGSDRVWSLRSHNPLPCPSIGTSV